MGVRKSPSSHWGGQNGTVAQGASETCQRSCKERQGWEPMSGSPMCPMGPLWGPMSGSLLSSYFCCPQLLKPQPCFEASWSCCFELDLLPTLLLMKKFDGYKKMEVIPFRSGSPPFWSAKPNQVFPLWQLLLPSAEDGDSMLQAGTGVHPSTDCYQLLGKLVLALWWVHFSVQDILVQKKKGWNQLTNYEQRFWSCLLVFNILKTGKVFRWDLSPLH